MNPSEAARHLRRLERKADELRDDLDELRAKIDARPDPVKNRKKKNDDESDDNPDREFET